MSKDQMIEKIMLLAGNNPELRVLLETLYSKGRVDAIEGFMKQVAKS